MAKTQYLDLTGLQQLVKQIQAADTAVKTYAGTLPADATQTNILDYVLAQISESEFSGDAADVTITDTAGIITAENVEDALAEIVGNVNTIAGTGDGSFDKAIKDAIGELKIGETSYDTVKAYVDALNSAVLTIIHGETGSLNDLTTTAKGTIVAAINEVDAAAKANTTAIGTKKVAAAEGVEAKDATGLYKYVDDAVAAVDSTTANAITISTATTSTGMLKSYQIYQGGSAAANLIGTIDIPKDLVVSSGAVVKDPAGQAAGTYIELTIANQTNPLYINVKDLVDVYTAQASATQVQLAVSSTNEISASIVAKSITKTELADALKKEIEDATTAIGTAKTADAAGTGLTGRIEALETSAAAVDYSGKADKVTSATAGNFAGLDSNGNLTDSGKKAADFEAAGTAAGLVGTIPASVGATTTSTVVAYVDAKCAAVNDDIGSIPESSITALFSTTPATP